MSLESAQKLQRKGDHRAALDAYLAFGRATGNTSYAAFFGAGRSAGALRNFSEAINHFEQAAYIAPHRPEPLIELANLYYRIGQNNTALKKLDAAEEIIPSSEKMTLLKLRILSALEAHVSIEEVCQDKLKSGLSKKDEYAWTVRLIRSIYFQGDAQRAGDMAHALLQKDRDNDLIFSTRTNTHDIGDFRDAEIDVILNCYQRSNSVEFQRWWLDFQSIPPRRYWIWNNFGGSEFPQFRIQGADNAICDTNHKFYGRFAYAMLSQASYIAVFDDDTIPGTRWFENCLSHFSQTPGLYGTIGVTLDQDNLYFPNSRTGWIAGGQEELARVDLVGHAWFLQRDWLRYFWYEQPATFETGEDMHLSFSIQKHLNLPTLVPPHPESSPGIWGSVLGEELGGDIGASSNQKGKSHYSQRDMCVSELVNRGWKLSNV